jgi:hypothetical protein
MLLIFTRAGGYYVSLCVSGNNETLLMVSDEYASQLWQHASTLMKISAGAVTVFRSLPEMFSFVPLLPTKIWPFWPPFPNLHVPLLAVLFRLCSSSSDCKICLVPFLLKNPWETLVTWNGIQAVLFTITRNIHISETRGNYMRRYSENFWKKYF